MTEDHKIHKKESLYNDLLVSRNDNHL